MHQSYAPLLIFSLTYLGLAAGHIFSFKINRTGIALLGAIAMVVSRSISPDDALASINFATIITLYGLMILSGQLWLSGFYTFIAEKISSQLNHPGRFLLLLMLCSGLLSAFLINDVVVLAFTPVLTLSLLRKKMNPIPFLMGLALSSNIGAAATPLGNPQNILVATEANLSFTSYLIWCFPPVLLALLAAFALVWLIGNKDLQKTVTEPSSEEKFPPLDRIETIKGLVVVGVVVALFFTGLSRPLVMITAAGFLLLSHKIESSELLAKADYSILTLFVGLFIVVGGIERTSFPGHFLQWMNAMGLHLENPRWLSAVTVFLSNLMSNAATVMLLVKVVPLQNSNLAYVLCLSNSFAGNLLVIGSIANLIVVEQARAYGVKVGFRSFAKYGIPVTVTSIMILMVWMSFRGV